MRRRCLVAALLLMGCGAAAAQNIGGEICYSAAPSGSTPVASTTLFACPIAGNLTVPQLAAAGWSIVKLAPVISGGVTRSQLLIQRRDRLFRHGFQ